jgi:hypothetical protein
MSTTQDFCNCTPLRCLQQHKTSAIARLSDVYNNTRLLQLHSSQMFTTQKTVATARLSDVYNNTRLPRLPQLHASQMFTTTQDCRNCTPLRCLKNWWTFPQANYTLQLKQGELFHDWI